MRVSPIPCLLGFILLTLGATPLSAMTYSVDPYGTGDFPTIQAAIDTCVAGDIVELTDGEFTGDGNRDIDFLGKAITLRSQSGNPSSCVLNCDGSYQDPHHGLRLVPGEGSDTRIQEISIQSAFGSEPGGGIACIGSSPTIVGCRIEDCVSHMHDSGGIYCESAQPLLEDCRIQSCAGGLYCLSSPAVVRGCRFEDNNACDSGAITSVSSAMMIEDCTFVENFG
jgi:hypothetical protein